MDRGTIRFFSRFPQAQSEWDLKAVVRVIDLGALEALSALQKQKERALAKGHRGFRRFLANHGGVIAAVLIKKLKGPLGTLSCDVDDRDRAGYRIDVFTTLSAESPQWRITLDGVEVEEGRQELTLA
jgi:hypothetical protein